jgi:hypothetical protein
MVIKGADLDALLTKKAKLEHLISTRKEEISFKMSRVPMLKLVDKIYFIIGVGMSWLFAYFLGRYPRDLFLAFFTVLIIPLVFWRWVRYYKIGMHYYLIDICYFSTALILYFIWLDPFNEELIRIGFLTSNGCLAVSIMAFRNSLVFHDMDCMTSMGIHGAPMIITHHIRWFMLPAEAAKPAAERQFTALSDPGTWEYVRMNFINPHIFYFAWLGLYFVTNFVINFKHEKMYSRNYNTLYRWFYDNPYWRAVNVKLEKTTRLGDWSGPVHFCIGHYLFFEVSHLLAMLQFEYYWLNLGFCIFYILVAMWNGANYYMEFFAKRYEQKLAKMEELAGKSLSMEERQKAAWGE